MPPGRRLTQHLAHPTTSAAVKKKGVGHYRGDGSGIGRRRTVKGSCAGRKGSANGATYSSVAVGPWDDVTDEKVQFKRKKKQLFRQERRRNWPPFREIRHAPQPPLRGGRAGASVTTKVWQTKPSAKAFGLTSGQTSGSPKIPTSGSDQTFG